MTHYNAIQRNELQHLVNLLSSLSICDRLRKLAQRIIFNLSSRSIQYNVCARIVRRKVDLDFRL